MTILLAIAHMLFGLSSALVLLVLLLIVFHFIVLAHISRKIGRYPLLDDLNEYRKKGDQLAELGYWNAWVIFFIAALLILPPLIVALSR
jgi:hypothetical protein